MIADEAQTNGDIDADNTAGGDMNGSEAQPGQQDTEQFGGANQPNVMAFGMAPGMLTNMGWNGQQDFNPMAQMMPNNMGNFPNPMGK
jgi:hypothetical protein